MMNSFAHGSRAVARVLAVATATAILVAASAMAQDANYWTLQHGNQARLLGGAVVGGSEDLSATYYNPARLAMLSSAELLLSGNVFDYTTLSIEGAVRDQTFKTTRLGSVPSLFAGKIGSYDKDGSRWAYSLLGRYASDFRIDEWRDIDDLIDFTVDQAVGSYSFSERLSEYWGGFSWAHPLGDQVAVGITGYVAVRNQESRSLILAQAASGDTTGIALQRRNFNYTHVSALAKVGLSFDLGALQLGLAATTPNLKIYGKGTLFYDESYSEQRLDGNGYPTGQMISGYEKDIPTNYHAAPSLSAGATHDWDHSSLHLTAEWFAGISDYRVLEITPIPSSDGSLTAEPDLRDVRNAVFNVGLGFEHRFKERLQGFLSFRTDFSSIEQGSDSQIAVSIWDIYHVGCGATFDALNTNFTLGVIYAFGGAETPPSYGLLPDDEADDLVTSDTLEYRYRRLTGLVGFAFGF